MLNVTDLTEKDNLLVADFGGIHTFQQASFTCKNN